MDNSSVPGCKHIMTEGQALPPAVQTQVAGLNGEESRPRPCHINGRQAHRILIVRPSAIGDVVMASPILRVLRASCSDARICWLVEPHIVDVLKTNPCLDQVLVWPKSTWVRFWKTGHLLKLLREVFGFISTLRKERFDLALDIQGLLRSRLLAWCTGAPVRVGFASKEPGRFLLTRVVSRGEDSDRMGSEYLHMIQTLGFEAGQFHPCLDIDAGDSVSAREELKSAGISGRYVVFAPFTTRPQKHWFEERWRELAAGISQRFGLPVVLLGGPADRDAARRICNDGEVGIVSMAGRLSLAQSMAVIREAGLLVGVDTGLTHMGPAFDRPTIALFGATCPYRVTTRANTVVLHHQQPCSPCRRSPTCDGRYPCMQAISVDEVMASCVQLLSGTGEAA